MWENDLKERYYEGFFLGLFFIIALYHFLLYFFVKDISYVFYSLFLVTFIGGRLLESGYAFELLGQNFQQLNDNSWNFIFVAFGIIINFFYVYFAKTFLLTKKYTNTWNNILNFHLKGSIIFLLIFISKQLIFSYFDFNSSSDVFFNMLIYVLLFWSILAACFTSISAFFCLRNGFKPAKYFLFANIPLVIGVLVTFIVEFFSDLYYLSDPSLKLGAAIQSLIFSLGLGYKVNLLQIEKQQTQEKALEILEQKVQERTIEVVKQKEVIEEKNKDITDSINYAKRIQQAKLPKKEEIYSSLPQSFILFKPKDIVSGDFYYFHKNDKEIFIASADCTGHGVPGAFMSMIGSEKLDDAVSHSNDTSEILKHLNKGIKTSLKQSDSNESTRDGMDIALCSVDIENRIVKYAGANRPIWIIRKGKTEIEEIKATKKAIGGFTEDNQHFDTHEIKLQQGDTFYLSTDGYADTFSGQGGKKLMTKRFKEILLDIQHKTMQEQEKHLDDFIENWKAGTEQVDDILVIGIRL